jgi:single-strand DNA-binding protein
MSLNKCMIIGNLGRDPEMRYSASGVAITQFSVAVNRNSRDEAGEWKEETEWFRVVVWGQQAERAAEYLRKGNKVYIEGRLQTRKYTDRNGVERMAIEVIANEMEMLTPKSTQTSSPSFVGGQVSNNDDLGDLDDHPF